MAVAEAVAEATGDPSRRERLAVDWRDTIVYVSCLFLFGVFAIMLGDEGFLEASNLLNILVQAAPIAVMASATVFVLSAGEIDLSIGSVVALAALVTAVVLRDAGVALAVVAGFGVGVAAGLVNGVLVTRVGIPSFLVTLGSLTVVAGIARTVNDQRSVAVSEPWYSTTFGGGEVLSVSTIIVWALAIGLLSHIIYRHGQFGAHVRAVGDNRAAAASAGIHVTRVRIAVLTISAMAAALAGMLYAGRLGTARYTLGENDLLTVIAAAIIGGTSLFGGQGTIVGALVGAVLLAMLNNGLILAGFSVSQQGIALGILIVLAVAFGRRSGRETQ